MSRRPAIGKRWLEKYAADAYPHGKVVIRGKQTNTPRYYDKQFKKLDPIGYEDLKLTRELELLGKHLENTHERLAAKQRVTEAKLKMLKRKI